MDSNTWDQKYSTEEFIYTKVENRFVVELCKDLDGTNKRAIDLAGGEGRNSVWLAKRGWQVENIDFSEVALLKYLSFAKDEGVLENCSSNCADALSFTPLVTPVDLAVIAYLQIPENDLATAIERLSAHVVSGGTLMGVWHSRDNLEGGFGGPRDPQVLPNVETISQALAGTGLEIEVLENRDGQIQTKEGLKPSVTLVLLAKRPA
ncbi:MAG: class I SAM-dependent methyltransferase [Rhodoluna sp.]|nr:class I SAM-dependent methyltransferase [Rhodoluna sp.]